MFAVLDKCMFESESSLLDALSAVERKTEMYDFEHMSDEEFTKTIRELYGPALNTKRQKEYWKDKVYISYVDGVDPDTTCIKYTDETLVYISSADWKKYHEEIHRMTMNEVIKEFALEVKDKEYYASKNVNSNLYT